MTVVSQDIFFDGTIREHVVMGQPDITGRELENALDISQAHLFMDFHRCSFQVFKIDVMKRLKYWWR